MITIDEKQVQTILTENATRTILQKAYLDCEKGNLCLGGRICLPIRGEENSGQWLVANCKSAPYFGSKFSCTFPGNIAQGLPSGMSVFSLYSAQTGELVALIDANYLTGMKTAGSAAIATDLMAKPSAGRLGIIGTGVQALFQVLAIQEVREITELRLYSRSPQSMDRLIRQLEVNGRCPYPVIKTASADECAAGSDIICTCTNTLTPVLHGNILAPGTHINAIGSFTPTMQEIDEETVLRADKIMTEHAEGLWAAAGDILIPLKKGIITREVITGSIGEALTGKIPVREKDDEITLYESVGSGVLDLALSIAIYEQAIQNTNP